MRFALTLLLLTPTIAAVADEAESSRFQLRDGDRVVFLGGTLVERMQRYGHVEATLTAWSPEANVSFRNLGWSGDTVWAESRGLFDPPAKGYERMVARVGEIEPTVLFLAYGNVESFADEEGLEPFVKQYEKLLDDLTKVAADDVRVVLLSPLPMETVAPPGVDVAAQNRRIALYGKAVHDLCERRGHRYLDLAEYVAGVNAIRAAEDPLVEVRSLTTDGLQFHDFGYRQLANAIAYHLGLHGGDNTVIVNFDRDRKVSFSHSCKVSNVEPTERGIRFDLTATRLEPHWLLTVEGAADDSLALRSGDTTYAADWGLSGTGTFSLREHPDAEQYDRLRAAIIEKNRLYFLGWRPLNVTYLTLFRKHEQGRHAQQAEEYARLVAEREQEIAKLRKPVTRSCELVPAGK